MKCQQVQDQRTHTDIDTHAYMLDYWPCESTKADAVEIINSRVYSNDYEYIAMSTHIYTTYAQVHRWSSMDQVLPLYGKNIQPC